MQKGYYLSLEAFFSCLVFFSLLTVLPSIEPTDLKEVHLLQKENDLIKVWVMQHEFGEKEMKNDIELVFSDWEKCIELNGKRVKNECSETENSISTEGFIAKEQGIEKITLRVFY